MSAPDPELHNLMVTAITEQQQNENLGKNTKKQVELDRNKFNHKLVEINPSVTYRWRIKPLITTAIKEVSQIVRTGIGAGLVVTLYLKANESQTRAAGGEHLLMVKATMQLAFQKYNLDISPDDFLFEHVIPQSKTVLQ